MWHCSYCAATREKPEKRLPAGWKRLSEDGACCCDRCWSARYAIRAVTLPIVKPLDCDWDELDQSLREMWALTTQLANWIMTEMYARDVRRKPGEIKMPSMLTPYLYPEARQRFPALPSQTVAAILNTVQAKYRASRYEVVWTCAASLPTYRYPTPFPVPAQGWFLAFEDQRPVVSLRIADQRLRFALMGSARYRRQLDALRQMVQGEAHPCEMAVYRRGKETLCKLVAWLPKQTSERIADSTLFVRTDGEALIVALNIKDDRLWTFHADQARRWSARHRRQLQRWSDDQKAEHRPVAPFDERRRAAVRTYRDQMDTLCHQAAALIAGYAQRRKFARVVFRDEDHSFCEEFPWFKLRELIGQKLNERAIEFEHASAEVVAKTP